MARVWWMPSPTSVVFLTIVVVAVVFAGNYIVNRDAELARHVALGRYMIDTGHLMTEYPFSYTTPGREFVAIEYGTQLFFATLYKWQGFFAGAIATVLLLAAAHAVQMHLMLKKGVEPVFVFVMVMLSAAMSAMFWQARPQIISMLFIAVLLHALEFRMPRRPWWALILFCIWANLHPAWLYGLILIGIYGFGAFVEAVRKNTAVEGRTRLAALIPVFVAACVGTLLTPLGLKLHKHMMGFFALKYQLDNIGEFLSPDFHNPIFRPLLVGILLIVVLLAVSRRRLSVTHLIIVVTHIQQTLQASRYSSQLAITGVTVLAIHLAPEVREFMNGVSPLWSRFNARWSLGRGPIAWVAAVAVILLLFATQGKIGGHQFVPTTLSAERFPVTLVNRAIRSGRAGKVYAETISWSGYVMFAWPRSTIFIDGSGDFFGDDLLRESHRVRSGLGGFDGPLIKHGAELVIANDRGALAQALLNDPDWRMLDCDDISILFGKIGDPETTNARGKPVGECLRSWSDAPDPVPAPR